MELENKSSYFFSFNPRLRVQSRKELELKGEEILMLDQIYEEKKQITYDPCYIDREEKAYSNFSHLYYDKVFNREQSYSGKELEKGYIELPCNEKKNEMFEEKEKENSFETDLNSYDDEFEDDFQGKWNRPFPNENFYCHSYAYQLNLVGKLPENDKEFQDEFIKKMMSVLYVNIKKSPFFVILLFPIRFFFAFDMITDIILIADLFSKDNYYAYLILGFLCLPYLFCWFTLFFGLYTNPFQWDWMKCLPHISFFFILYFFLGLPCLILCDIWILIVFSYKVPEKGFFLYYERMRSVAEVILESIPQLVIQFYIFIDHKLYINPYDSMILIVSIFFSILSLIKTFYITYSSSIKHGKGYFNYILGLFKAGVGLIPGLDEAIERQSNVFRLPHDYPLSPTQLSRIFQAFRWKRLILSNNRLDSPELSNTLIQSLNKKMKNENLVSINLSNTGLATENGFKYLIKAMEYSDLPELQVYKLQTPKQSHQFSSFLRGQYNHHHPDNILDFSNLGLNDNDIDSLCHLFTFCKDYLPFLYSLNLSGNQFNDKQMAKFVAHLHSLYIELKNEYPDREFSLFYLTLLNYKIYFTKTDLKITSISIAEYVTGKTSSLKLVGISNSSIIFNLCSSLSVKSLHLYRHQLHPNQTATLWCVKDLCRENILQTIYLFEGQTYLLARKLAKFIGGEQGIFDFSNVISFLTDHIALLCYNMTKIVLFDCFYLNDDDLCAIAEQNPALEYLNVSRCTQLTDKSMQILSKKCKFLSYLNVENCFELTTKFIDVLGVNCTGLKSLILKDCKRMNEDDIGIPLRWWKVPSIEELNLENFRNLSDDQLQKILLNMKNIKDLNLRKCVQLTDASCSYLSKCEFLESLKLDHCAKMTDYGFIQLAHCVSLKSLSIRRCIEISDSSINTIFQYLILSFCHSLQAKNILKFCSSQLQVLNLKGFSPLTNEMISRLVLPQLTQLNFQGCFLLNDDGVASLIEHIPHLQHIILQDCFNISDNFVVTLSQYCPKITKIDLSNCDKITNNGLRALNKLKNLDNLQLDYCYRIDGRTGQMLSWPQLNYFSARECTELSCYFCSVVSKHTPRLQCLDLSQGLKLANHNDCLSSLHMYCPQLSAISLHGFESLVNKSLQNLIYNCALQDVDLGGCTQISDEIVCFLVKHNQFIIKLSLHGCVLLTDKSLYEISLCFQLSSLNIGGCNRITECAVRSILTKCKNLRFLNIQGMRRKNLYSYLNELPNLNLVI